MMTSKLTSNSSLPPTWLRFLIVVLLVLGIFFRFFNLDKKVYWLDETYTSLRISGYTTSELSQHITQVFDGHVFGVENFKNDLQEYQYINSKNGLIDTIKSLAVEDPQHSPLYYIMARYWVQWLGNSVAAIRSLSALISLLVFPCIYWLCLELFGSSLVGWIAVVLIAVSPFHVLYAQEAREYSLWTVTILLSSASLLHAMRLKTKLSWGTYAATVALGFYTYPFSGLVTIGHGIYVASIERFRLSKTLANYLLASLVGLLASAPWLLVIIFNLRRFYGTTVWTVNESELPLVKVWLQNLSYAFFDVDSGELQSQFAYDNPLTYFLLLTPLILVVYSVYFLCRKTPKKILLFILTLMGVTALILALPDLVLGGQRTTIARYLIPCYLGIQLAVAYLLAHQISSISVTILRRQKLWQLITMVLLSGGVLSCTIISQAESSWNKLTEPYTPQVARIINQANQPLVISDDQLIHKVNRLLCLSYLLEPKVQLGLDIPKIPDGFSDVFLYDPAEAWRHKFEKEYKIEPIYKRGGLWQLEKK